MSIIINRLRNLRRAERGATMVEFAFVVTPLFMILLGLTDFGYRAYVASMVEGTVHRAARMATVGNKTPSQIDDFVRSQLDTFSSNGTVTIAKKSYYQFSNVDKEEPLCAGSDPNIDKNGNGAVDPGDCYQDINNNGGWDDDSSKIGIGGSDDIVFYSVSLQYPRVVPLGNLFGWADSQTISANTLMRNQPYGSQVTPPERTRP
jgi:hypothetical protein